MNFRLIALFLCWLTWNILGAVSPARAQVYKGVELVKADLLADTTAIAPGKPFTIGLRLKMAPHWHTYWLYSGDAGLATKINWKLPAGFKAGPIQWPIPVTIKSAGDIINYGYSDQVMLLTEIIPPAQLPPGEVTLQAKADWLVCEELCIPGSKELTLKLPSGSEPRPANEAAFAESRALLPRASEGAVSVQRRVEGNNLFLNFQAATPPDSKYGLEFFPLPPEDVEVGHPESSGAANDAKGTTATFKLPLITNPAGASKVGGVLVTTSADGDRVGYQIEGEGGMVAPVAGATTVSSKSSTPGETAPGSGAKPAGGSLLSFLFLGFLGGIILNVMPCVLPVISLKVFSFVRQANEAPERIFKLGLAYAAGVFAWFLGFAALVVILKAAGREIGYAAHMQNPWFVVGLSAAVFVFALNLLGVFEFILPGAAAGALTEVSQKHEEGYSGAFFQGVLATILGSACTAPLFGVALGFAFAQSGPVIFAMFAAIAAGMSLPFVLLTAFPGWLRFLPKPGVWMERVKQATGFLMIATALWLLSILGDMRGADAVIWTGVLLLTLGAVCWIQGTFNTLVASGGVRTASRVAMLALLLGGGWLSLYQVAAARLPVVAPGNEPKDFPRNLQAALTEKGRPVFVDFTAAWCVNCKVNERGVLATEPIQKAIKDTNTVFLTADWTNGEPGITALLRQFGRAGVPLYVIYPADRSKEPIVLPEILTNQLVLDGLKSAQPLASLEAPRRVAEQAAR
jgi:thiol:disulfide interchange protein/DsbC/DsbD-like thiol-disulfide interchange protein